MLYVWAISPKRSRCCKDTTTDRRPWPSSSRRPSSVSGRRQSFAVAEGHVGEDRGSEAHIPLLKFWPRATRDEGRLQNLSCSASVPRCGTQSKDYERGAVATGFLGATAATASASARRCCSPRLARSVPELGDPQLTRVCTSPSPFGRALQVFGSCATAFDLGRKLLGWAPHRGCVRLWILGIYRPHTAWRPVWRHGVR